jgi:hypothetical protein
MNCVCRRGKDLWGDKLVFSNVKVQYLIFCDGDDNGIRTEMVVYGRDARGFKVVD